MSTPTATAAPTTAVLVGKCKACQTLTRVERSLVYGTMPNGRTCVEIAGGAHVDCADCGRRTDSRQAKLSTIKCGAKCVNATGPACSCECGGRNHGGH